jgi:hypothetical protein
LGFALAIGFDAASIQSVFDHDRLMARVWTQELASTGSLSYVWRTSDTRMACQSACWSQNIKQVVILTLHDHPVEAEIVNMIARPTKSLMIAAAGLAAFMAGTIPARADSITYVLDQTNVDAGALLDGVSFATVTIDDDTPNTLRFTVNVLAPLTLIAGSNFGIDNFAFNVSGSNPLQDAGVISGQWSLPPGWSANVAPPPNQADGFGRFDAAVDGGGGARVVSLVCSLHDTGLNLYRFAELSTNSAGQGNVFFSAHIAGFIGPGGVSSGYFGGSTLVPVPLPSALMLLLGGLWGLGAAVRRRYL